MYKDFLSKLGFNIKNKILYDSAFTHNSYTNENKMRNVNNYQRLEFLGDAVLQNVISYYLYKKFPEVEEGNLTRLRSICVREKPLAECARIFSLGQFIRLGNGEYNSRGFEKDSILADVYESLIGAIYHDLGFEAANDFIYKTLISMFEEKNMFSDIKDYKTELQELLQVNRMNLMRYVVKDRFKYNKNDDLFIIEVVSEDIAYGLGIGFSKKDAEQKAAQDALNKLYKQL